MTREIALKILWDSCCHNLDTQKAYKVLKNDTRPQGEWIIIDDTEQFIAKCSICGRIEDSRMIKDYPFCHCGADMRCAESHLDNTPTVAINKDFYKEDKSNPINRSDLFQ